tara:strand:- start:1989 stop:3131 length:1143 start_codon:yes stop_codon:yes gene_type:complete
MKIINKLLYVLFLIFISFSVNAIDTKAEQAVVIEFETGEILFEKNSNIRVPPASMTKIMTTYIAFDRIKNTDLSIKDKCKISPKAYKMGGSRTFLEIDDYVSIDTLLRGIIIQSGNDASVALAECLSGTEENFSKIMNNYSKKIGLKNTNFINSSGWPDTNHYSTVKDLAVLSNALISQFPNLYLLFSEKNFKYNDIDQPNRNLLIQELPGVDGLKTGFTKKSGWGIAVSASRNNRRISVVINGTNSSRTRLNEASNLINWAFNQTNKTKLIKKNEIIKQVDVWLGNKSSVNLIAKNDVVSTISYGQLQLLKSKIEYTNPITAPIDKNEEYGKLLIDIEGKPIVEVSLFSEENIKKINPFLRIFAALKYLIFGTSLDEKI